MALQVLSAGSTLHGARECAGLFGAVDIATDHGHNIRKAVKLGAADADVVLLPADMIAALQAAGLARDPVALGTVGIGGVIRAGSPMPGISTLPELRDALAAADMVLLTRAPTGEHLLSVIANLRLADAVTPKLLRFDTSTALNVHLAARSDNALGFGPETEIRAGKSVTWVGDVPAEFQIALPYAAAILTRTTMPDEARAFASFLGTDKVREIFRRSGVR
jgi:molybdate transport system substrate-binding protein